MVWDYGVREETWTKSRLVDGVVVGPQSDVRGKVGA